MTEVPEHLLQRSKAARARLSGAPAPDDSAAEETSTAPATTAAAAPAAAAAAPAPVVEAPQPPWVKAAEARPRIPVWALSVLCLLPIWAIVYATTNDAPTADEGGPLAEGEAVYSTCAACHGGGGGGGVGPALNGGAVLETFPEPGEQIRWVLLGSAGYQAESATTYGVADTPIAGGMPAQPGLTAEELLTVVRHERETLSEEEFDIAVWEEAAATLAEDPNPEVAEKAAEFEAVIASWEE